MTEQPDNAWPSWRYGPDGQEAIFHREEDVPEGWVDHPGKVGAESEAPKAKGRPKKVVATSETTTEVVDEPDPAEEPPVTEGDF